MTLLENLLVALVGPNESVRSPRAPHPDRFLIACALPDRTFSMSFFMDEDTGCGSVGGRSYLG